MELRQLQIFSLMMECASVTRTAQLVNLTPGAVSLQLQSLASELRTELFIRQGKFLKPTPAAIRFAEHAKGILSKIREIEQEFENDPELDQRPFHFATGATTLIYRLRRTLMGIRKRYPLAPLRVTVAPTEEMVSGLHQRKFDLAVISLPYEESNLSLVPMFEEELLVLRPCATAMRTWHVGTMEPEELKRAQFLLYPERSNMRMMINGMFRELGIVPKVVMEADDTEAIKRLVESGFGYAILPEFALRTKPRFFQTYRIAGHRLARTQALAWVKTDYPRALTIAVARLLQESLKRRAY